MIHSLSFIWEDTSPQTMWIICPLPYVLTHRKISWISWSVSEVAVVPDLHHRDRNNHTHWSWWCVLTLRHWNYWDRFNEMITGTWTFTIQLVMSLLLLHNILLSVNHTHAVCKVHQSLFTVTTTPSPTSLYHHTCCTFWWSRLTPSGRFKALTHDSSALLHMSLSVHQSTVHAPCGGQSVMWCSFFNNWLSAILCVGFSQTETHSRRTSASTQRHERVPNMQKQCLTGNLSRNTWWEQSALTSTLAPFLPSRWWTISWGDQRGCWHLVITLTPALRGPRPSAYLSGLSRAASPAGVGVRF